MIPLPTDLADLLIPVQRDFEGVSAWMYLDAGGVVTAGVGHALYGPQDAANMRWEPGAVTTPADDYAAVLKAKPGQLAKEYAALTSNRLSDDAIDTQHRADLTAKWTQLNASCPWVSGCPVPAQAALLDLSFQVGAEGIKRGFPKLCAACQSSDWATAAQEVIVPAAQSSRNQWRQGQLKACAQL
jgi:GH24 family phage-related lysozyme (muramidase)